ncbi:MAG: ankyrin repeat domain-containing protein [Candidatus Marinimicrobia bacterium]|nr:ankyrin repeat domain-containing protein [Candidatus Neomarinimicrobiota bacterium]
MAWKGQPANIQALLDAGAKVNAKSEKGFTALMGAAGFGHLPSVQALLDAGAEADTADKEGLTLRYMRQTMNIQM